MLSVVVGSKVITKHALVPLLRRLTYWDPKDVTRQTPVVIDGRPEVTCNGSQLAAPDL